jgi:hypothetical protein
MQIIHPDGRVLFLDSTTKVSITEGASPALHPIESLSPASDHVELNTTTIAVSAVITENPTRAQEDRQAGSVFLVSDVLAGLTGPARMEAALAFLRDCVGEYLLIYSGRFFYENCLLTAWPHEWDIKQAHTVSLSFTIARRVNVALVDVPPSSAAPSSSKKKKEKGEGGTEVAPDKSVLYEISEGIAGGLDGAARWIAEKM